MNKKLKIAGYGFVVLVVIIAVALVVVFKSWPEYQATLGSSEKWFSEKNYKTGIEIKIDMGPEFFMVINEEKQLSYIFIENENALSLVNKDIEGKQLKKAIPEIFQILLTNKQLENNKITIINYGDRNIYEDTLTLIKDTLTKNSKTNQIIEQTSTLEQKATEENLEEKEQSQVLWTLYLRSREFMDQAEEEKEPTAENKTETQKITKDMASTYANSIYQKIVTYMINSNIKNQSRDNGNLPIQYIPGDSENKVYPTTSSWYYIENYKVYAEITIASQNNNYTFCYQGAIEEKKEGLCS